MIALMLFGLLSFQSPAAMESDLWREIAELEHYLQESINAEFGQVKIIAGDPVRGYHIEGAGVMLMIPVRHRPQARQIDQEFPKLANTFKDQSAGVPSNRELDNKVRVWKQELRKRQELKESNLERVVKKVRNSIPEILARLTQMSEEQNLTIVIEEREPAWAYGSFGRAKTAQRRVVTFFIDKDLAEKIRSSQAVAEWEADLQRKSSLRFMTSLAAE